MWGGWGITVAVMYTLALGVAGYTVRVSVIRLAIPLGALGVGFDLLDLFDLLLRCREVRKKRTSRDYENGRGRFVAFRSSVCSLGVEK